MKRDDKTYSHIAKPARGAFQYVLIFGTLLAGTGASVAYWIKKEEEKQAQSNQAKLYEKAVKAVAGDDINRLQELFRQGAPIAKKDESLLMYASSRQMVAFLTNNGADLTQTDSSGKSVVTRVVINYIPTADSLPQTVAEYNPQSPIAYLYAKGADMNKADHDGRTPLHYAALFNASETVETLIQCGARVNVADNFGQTPLMYAAKSGNTSVIKSLLYSGADYQARDKQNHTVSDYAVKGGNPHVIRFFQRKPFNPYTPFEHIRED